MKITSVNDRALVRLISETHHKPPVLRGLVDSDEEADILAEIEGETSARLIAEREGSPALDRRELAFARRSHDLSLYGQSHINAAFAYTRPTGNRFNTGDARRVVLRLGHADERAGGRVSPHPRAWASSAAIRTRRATWNCSRISSAIFPICTERRILRSIRTRNEATRQGSTLPRI